MKFFLQILMFKNVCVFKFMMYSLMKPDSCSCQAEERSIPLSCEILRYSFTAWSGTSRMTKGVPYLKPYPEKSKNFRLNQQKKSRCSSGIFFYMKVYLQRLKFNFFYKLFAVFRLHKNSSAIVAGFCLKRTNTKLVAAIIAFVFYFKIANAVIGKKIL